ncbi:MAG: nicotinate-nucleotide adenylyltransferase [Bacteroidaceae bacterium]|nr:nicotinate-nucleotide adenylyltransferase [Bacteroidaceae bacterium]MBR1755027.1 nicotinate-nucleotide adenylyltransferase [Bacteroidaceae bacterium]
MTTGIYGGSFNPIHLGHLSLGRWLVRHREVEELWFLVSPQNPLKPAEGLLADEARLLLARKAVGRSRGLRVSDFEFHLPRPSYMVHTLEALRAAYPERDFVLVIGADNWHRFPQWYRSADILRHHRILIYPRPGFPIDAAALPEGVRLVETPLHDISSTQIREAICQDAAYDGWGLPPRVWTEIQARGYYR